MTDDKHSAYEALAQENERLRTQCEKLAGALQRRGKRATKKSVMVYHPCPDCGKSMPFTHLCAGPRSKPEVPK